MGRSKTRNYTPKKNTPKKNTPRSNNSIPPSRARERGKYKKFNTEDNFPSQNQIATELDPASDTKKGPFKKIRQKIGEVTKDWNAEGLSRASDTFGDISEKTKGTFTSAGGIQSQGGPDKVAFRSEDYDEKARRILKQLGNPYE